MFFTEDRKIVTTTAVPLAFDPGRPIVPHSPDGQAETLAGEKGL